MKSTQSIKKYLLNFFFIVFLIVCGISLIFLGERLYYGLYMKRSNIELFQNRISADIKKINMLLESVQKIPQELALILEFHSVNTDELKILLESALFNNDELFGCAVSFEPYEFYKDSLRYSSYIYRSGDSTIYTDFDDPDYDYFNKEWYLLPKTLMKSIWSEPYYDVSEDNVLMSTYSVPFFKFNGIKEKFCGIVTVDVSVKRLSEAIESMGKHYNGYAFLVSENGTIIASPFEEWIYSETIYSLAVKNNLPVLVDIGRDLKKGESGIKKIEEFKEQKEMLVFYSLIQANNWGFILILPKSALYK